MVAEVEADVGEEEEAGEDDGASSGLGEDEIVGAVDGEVEGEGDGDGEVARSAERGGGEEDLSSSFKRLRSNFLFNVNVRYLFKC